MADINIKQVVKTVSTVISAVPGVLQHIDGESWVGADAYFQIFNRTTVPTLGAVPIFSWRVPAGGRFNANPPGPSQGAIIGEKFTVGITCGWSTTDETYTAAAIGGKISATGRNDA